MIFSGIPAKAGYGQGMITGMTYAILFLVAGIFAFTYLKRGSM